MNYIDKSIDLIRLTKEKNPLVDFAVNYVTANDSTSVTSYIGGSPVMTDDSIDAADVVEYGNVDALIFNIGTITEKQYHSMMEAGKKATEKGIPIVIDPVATSITSFRTMIIQRMLDELNVSVIKGNLGEIKSCLGLKTNSKGVDSNENPEGAEEFCINLARKRNLVVAMTGPKDIITDGERIVVIENGTDRLPKVIGTGCILGAMVATYCGATNDYVLAASTAIMLMGVAGELASEITKEDEGHYKFKVNLIDVLSTIVDNEDKIKAKANMKIIK
ncbi:hydroxyethylthiazole kinase [Clostridium algidicarnis]|uniref:hydroxyethylthiazole kinase n=1 Tax=Clostridium algidicarnis TaxID=37659 RepID=UPI003FD70FBE